MASAKRVPAALSRITDDLCRDLAPLAFEPPVAAVLNPLVHARVPHRRFLAKYAQGTKSTLLLGMNPGPWGMNQTGVPFGEVSHVRDWMGIEGKVDSPLNAPSARPILGFKCTRSEVSGARLWGWAKDRFGTPERFFADRFVINYCPLIFLEEGGRNRTPDKLLAAERKVLEEICDHTLQRFVAHFQPELILGVGKFAEKCAKRTLGKDGPRIESIPHPSPASPAANRGWAALVDRRLAELGIDWY
ncbi:MAG: uracil-DNA glycosylase family protein [Planctomycetota bacterium]